jgi:excisionase family DNA binding protein
VKLDLPDDLLDALADAVAERVAERLAVSTSAHVTPWLDAKGAADYLACSVSRIRTLTLTGDLPHHRDGRRPLYYCAELDAYVRNGGAKCP